MFRHLKTASMVLIVTTLLTGVVYPLAVTAVARLMFPRSASGSFIEVGGTRVGSDLIGQPFSSPEFFWGRLSATAPYAYNAAASSGSNFGPLNPALQDAVKARIDALRAADPQLTGALPVDLVTSSGSGLDPHISPAAADVQVRRVAKARGISEEKVRRVVQQYTQGRQLGLLGEPRVNVLQVNLALSRLTQ